MRHARLLPAVALAVALLLSAGSGAQPPRPVPDAPPGAAPGLPVVPRSAGAFVTIKVSDLATHPDLKPVLAQLAKQPDALAGVTEIVGVSPLEIDRVTLFWPRLSGNAGADPVLVVTTREPFNEVRVLKNLRAEPVFDGNGRGGHGRDLYQQAPRFGVKQAAPDVTNAAPKSAPLPEPKPAPLPPVEKPGDDPCAAADHSGDADPLYYALERGPFAALFLSDDRTLVFLPDGADGGFTHLALLAAGFKKNVTGPLADAIAEANKHTFAAGVNLVPLFREFDRRVPRELVPYAALFAARTAVITGDLDKSAKLHLTLKFDDATAAKRAAPVLEEGIATVAEKVGEWAAELQESRRPFEKAASPIVVSFAAGLKKAVVKADGATVAATAEVDAGPVAAKALGELLLAVQSRKKAELRMNNLKQIGLALHSYHDVNNRFPTNVYGPKGEVLLSWRVQLLPYLEEQNLFNQFKMDEAWDGPTNKALVEKMPKVFQAADRAHAKGHTFYQGFIGPDARKVPPPKGVSGRPWLLQGEKDGIGFLAITDGSSNTLAVIEARDGVVWSKPDDLPFGGAVPALGEKGWDHTPALRFDGSVTMFPTGLPADRFWPYVTINGGEVTIDPDTDMRPRRPFGGNPAPQSAPAKEQEKLPAQADGAARAELLVARLAATQALVQEAEAQVRVAALRAELLEKLVAKGGATNEELAKARAELAERTARLELHTREVRVLEAELRAALEKQTPRPSK